MGAIINGFTSIINIFKLIIEIIMSFFKAIGYLFTYIIKIPIIFGEMQIAFPSWLKGFIMLTLSISFVYILVGRVGGKSE